MQRVSWLGGLSCWALFACSAPESANHAVRCSPDLSCPDELVCYRGFCVDDQQDPATGNPVDDAPAVDTSDGGGARDPGDNGDASSADGGASAPGVGTQAPTNTAAPDSSLGVPGASVSGSGSTTAPSSAGSASTAPALDAAVAAVPVAADASLAPAPAPTPVAKPEPTPTPVPAAPTPTPTPAVDAGVRVDPCVTPCASPSYNEKQCNQCVKDTYGSNSSKLCGEADGDKGEADGDKGQVSIVLDPICLSLCLGAARNSPQCIGLFAQKGPSHGGEQP